jgi:hypothetical protein
MTNTIPNADVLAGVKAILADTSNENRVSDAWRVLAANGDTYADNAAGVTAKQPASASEWMFNDLVKHHWENTVGADAYARYFDKVAMAHIDNYLELIDDYQTWPTSTQIADSYVDALRDNGLPSVAAFDLVWEAAGLGNKWASMLGLEPERIGAESAESNNVSPDVAKMALYMDARDTLIDLKSMGPLGDVASIVGMVQAMSDISWNSLVHTDQGAFAGDFVFPEIDAFANNLFLASQTIAPARRDPLILDLDNDGLETVGINPTAPILFDHTGAGLKTATGWVKPDDAFLVLDRNGNSTIDSGQELFGDSTPLSAGGTAADGFAALAQEDTNHDGLVNASDARFANLRLWRDLNQDGISQTGELFTFASQGIVSLKVASTTNSQLLANGNQIADLGGFVRSDGSSGTLGAVEQLADVNLASNPFYSEFTDPIPLTEAAQTMADMQGAGQVRNLREAASLQTTQGSALATALTAFSAATTRSDQIAQLDSLLKAWSDTSSMASTASGAFAGVNLSVTFAGVSNGSPAWQAWMDKLSILERFNGQTFTAVPAAGTTLAINFFGT